MFSLLDCLTMQRCNKSSKPAWALSVDEAVAAEEGEEQHLMKFAQALDFDSFASALDDADLQEVAKVSPNSRAYWLDTTGVEGSGKV